MADMIYAGATGGGVVGGGGDVATAAATTAVGEDTAGDFYGSGAYAGPTTGNVVAAALGSSTGGIYGNAQPRPRYPGLYVGNLTWWTTDRDVIEAINSIGVNDVQEVKFFENRNNGQSKGFCVVTFNSDASLPIVMEKLPSKDLHGQNPIVTPYNRQNLNIFENQNKPRPQMNSTNGPTSHAGGIMGINSITGVHAAAAAASAQAAAASGIPYGGVAPANAVGALGMGYNQAALGMNSMGGGPRQPYHSGMRMPMRGPRPMIRGGPMSNGPVMAGGHPMNRMRFMSQQGWNNNQGAGGGVGGYNSTANRVGPQMNMDISNRLGGLGGGGGGIGSSSKQDDSGSDMLGSSSYYNPHHSNSTSDHYRSDMRDHRDHRDIRDSRDIRDTRDDRDSRRLTDDRPSRLDDRSSRHDDRATRDDRSSKQDDRGDRSRRNDDRSSRKLDEDRGSRRSDDRRDRDDRSARREDKPTSSSSSSRHHREGRSHRSSDRARSRSRSKERSRDGKERRDKDRGSERDRDRESRRDRY